MKMKEEDKLVSKEEIEKLKVKLDRVPPEEQKALLDRFNKWIEGTEN